MAVRPIVVWPDPRLREETCEVAEITDEIRELYKDLWDTVLAGKVWRRAAKCASCVALPTR